MKGSAPQTEYAKALARFKSTEQYEQLTETGSISISAKVKPYLENRIEAAFAAAWLACEDLYEKRTTKLEERVSEVEDVMFDVIPPINSGGLDA